MKPREIVIVSGKGGTGKTTISSSLCKITAGNSVICDTDVDAPDLWILMEPEIQETRSFKGMAQAEVQQARCVECGLCRDFCRFDAILMDDRNKAFVKPSTCEGCGGCAFLCPVQAIRMVEIEQGQYYFSNTALGPFWHARLNPGGENTGLLVHLLRQEARNTAQKENKGLIIVDGPPGVACPTISSLTGADHAIIVTEPSVSGQHDLMRLAELCNQLGVPFSIIINKFDLSPGYYSRIVQECLDRSWVLLGAIPFRKEVVDSIAKKKIPLDELNPEIEQIWGQFKTRIHK
ncbi:MAG: ATP-binding protein [Synergistales bacterium]|nr:ATP-binding protein [Synergistales bacterium]